MEIMFLKQKKSEPIWNMGYSLQLTADLWVPVLVNLNLPSSFLTHTPQWTAQPMARYEL